MADAVNKPAAQAGFHDRVAMLSVRADGTHDQYDPEIIGDPEFATEATKKQFREQAVSAVDFEERRGTGSAAEDVPQDSAIEALQKKHAAAAKSAESAAESVVKSLKS